MLGVDDNHEMREWLVRFLSRHHRVIAAEDGEAGLSLAVEALPDLILSDVMMPGIDGHELCRRLKSDLRTRNIPVVLITARHGPDAAVEGLQAGADDFILKPFSPQELLARIGTQLRVRQLVTTLIRAEKQGLLGILSSGIAHEVLNPVNAIVNSTPLVRRYLDDEPAGHEAGGIDVGSCIQLIDSVEEAGRRIERVVTAILTFSRGGREELSLRDARPAQGVESLLLILGHRLRQGYRIHTDFQYDLPFPCYAGLLDQAVANLIINALDAMPSGGEVHISIVHRGDDVQIAVRDHGPGVAPADRERIFQPFYTSKAPGVGTGLGLAISREIATLHGGSLELNDAVTDGAEFVIRLPLLRLPLLRPPLQGGEPAAAPAATPAATPLAGGSQ